MECPGAAFAAAAGTSSASGAAGSERKVDTYEFVTGKVAKRGGRNEVHLAAFPPWSRQLRAGMHFAAKTHVWVSIEDLNMLPQVEVQLFASDSMAILSRLGIPRGTIELSLIHI